MPSPAGSVAGGGSGSRLSLHEPSSLAPLPPPSEAPERAQDASRPPSQSRLLPPIDMVSSPPLPTGASSRRLSETSSSTAMVTAMVTTALNNCDAYLKYPTPVPTSSSGMLSSSPPRLAADNAARARARTLSIVSMFSERAPLSAVPSIELDANGDTLIMGRSSNSSHHQLSANRLVSRVHLKARYVPASAPSQLNKIEVECSGWNGAMLHCQGRSYDMHKGHILSFEAEGAEIILDVQDARVLLQWPKRDARDGLVDLGWEDSPRSARPDTSPLIENGSPCARGAENADDVGFVLHSSARRRAARIGSPVSPTPARAPIHQSISSDAPNNSQHSSILSDLPSASERDQSVEIYEDQEADLAESARRPSTAIQSFVTEVSKSFSSDLSDVQSGDSDMDKNDPDEENDPVLTSFGPHGANAKRRRASFSAASPKRRRLGSGAYVSSTSLVEDAHRPSKSASTTRPGSSARRSSPTPTPDDGEQVTSHPTDNGKKSAVVPDLSHVDVPTVTNHVINQLAFSRLSSNPLSTLLANLPSEDKGDLTREELKHVVEVTTCIGIIERQGKDADGRALESQYYYMPEADDDDNRRAAVVHGLRKPTLRNCRKHHVQYYWKRPRTP